MTQTLDELIRDEVAHARAHANDPLPASVKVTRPNKGTVLSVRLTDEEYGLLCARAHDEGMPVATEGRHLIVSGLRADIKQTVTQAIRENLDSSVLIPA